MSRFFPYQKAWGAFIRGGAFIRNLTVFWIIWTNKRMLYLFENAIIYDGSKMTKMIIGY
jgi:hypothetical protein